MIENNSDPYKVTKSGLIGVGIIVLILVAATFYLMYKSGVASGDVVGLLVCSIIGIGAILLATFIGIKIGRKNYNRLKLQFKETKKLKGIQSLGLLSLIFGSMLMGKNNILDLLIGLAWIMTGLGLIMVKKIGRVTFIVIAVVSVPLIIIDFFSGGIQVATEFVKKYNSPLPALAFIGIKVLLVAFCLLGVYYLNRPRIKELFK